MSIFGNKILFNLQRSVSLFAGDDSQPGGEQGEDPGAGTATGAPATTTAGCHQNSFGGCETDFS